MRSKSVHHVADIGQRKDHVVEVQSGLFARVFRVRLTEAILRILLTKVLFFFSSHQSKCLFDRGHFGTSLDHAAEGLLPGERFDADQQC